MRKNLLTFTSFFLSLGILTATAQREVQSVKPAKKITLGGASLGTLNTTADCDTTNLAATAGWTPYNYGLGPDGFVFGTNGYGQQQVANFFDLSATDYTYVSGALIYFAEGNSSKSANLSKTVFVNVYEDAGSGYPVNQLGSSVQVTLKDIKKDVKNGDLTEIIFSEPIAIPASKQFFIGIDFSNLEWSATTKDSLSVVANGNDETTNATFLLIPQLGAWAAANEVWTVSGDPLDVNLYIFPYVSTSAAGCTALPISFVNFSGSVKNGQAQLTWSTGKEINNKGFYIERSADGRNFSSVAFVPGSGNSAVVKSYSYADVSLATFKATTAYYRIKQVDQDGKASYSGILSLKLQNTAQWSVYPNPLSNNSWVQLNLVQSDKVVINVFNAQGRSVATINKGIMEAGSHTIPLNLNNLTKGVYFVKLTVGDKVYNQTVTK